MRLEGVQVGQVEECERAEQERMERVRHVQEVVHDQSCMTKMSQVEPYMRM